jgi:MFS family permease
MATFRYGGVTPLDEPQIITGVEWSIECDRENATFEIKTPHGSLRLPVKVRTIFGLIALVTVPTVLAMTALRSCARCSGPDKAPDTTIEWYDFILYSVVTGLVFGKIFFPTSDPLVGLLQAFAVYAVGFIARPIGAVIFGHYGDRIGRKASLIATLLITGLATFAVGLVPGYATIGNWGAVILTILRFIQGIGVGGEWGGSVLLSMEWARTNAHRGFIASWPQFGGPAGSVLANLVVLVFSAISGDQFLVWGWRIPFLLSIVVVAVGLYISGSAS